jgi:HAD superfamily hydrolase (TIGR01459 family)
MCLCSETSQNSGLFCTTSHAKPHPYIELRLFNGNVQNPTSARINLWRDALKEEEKEIQKRYNISLNYDVYDSRKELKQGLLKNHPNAYYIQGMSYILRTKTKQDFGEAVRHWRYAAKQNHFLAMLKLSEIYDLGWGVLVDHFEALKWQAYSLKQFNITSFDIDISVLGHIPEHLRGVDWYCTLWENMQNSGRPKMGEGIKPHFIQNVPPERKATLKKLKDQYKVFLFDIGGVITDGINPFPHAVEIINKLAQETDKKVIFISNSARPSETVKNSLIGYGIDKKLFDTGFISVIAAGEVVRQDLDKYYKGKKIYHFSFGEYENKDILKGMSDLIVNQPEDAEIILLTQFIEKKEDQIFDEYEEELRRITRHTMKTGCPILCVNPDVEAFHGPMTKRYCAGAFAKRLKENHGVPEEQIIYYGKPDQKIYHFMENAIPELSSIDKKHWIMFGDTLDNDILGAKELGIDSILVFTGNTAREMKEQEGGEKDVWYFLADYYKAKQAKPRYFMDSLTDEIQSRFNENGKLFCLQSKQDIEK